MTTVTYRAPDLLHWFESGSQEAFKSALKRSRALSNTASESSIKRSIVQAAGVAADFGRSAAAGIVHSKSGQTTYKLYEDKFTNGGTLGSTTVAYKDVSSIKAHGKDRFSVVYARGTMTVKPVAYLVSGRIKVPVGWERNDIEVPFMMFLEELSAHCGLEIESE